MLKRWLIAAGVLLAASGAHAGERLDAIKSRGVLRVGTTGDYKPFSFRDEEGSYRGADIEMAKLIAARLGVRLEIVPTVWATMMDDFKAQRFDIAMGGVTVLPARAAVGEFSTTMLSDGKRPIARCGDAGTFTDIASIDRPGVRVITNPGAANEQFAHENFPHAQLIVHRDNATVFDEIVAGRADVMVTDGIEVTHQALIHPQLCPTRVAAPFTRLEKAYWLPKDPDLLAAVDAVIDDAKRSGEWNRILDRAQQQP